MTGEREDTGEPTGDRNRDKHSARDREQRLGTLGRELRKKRVERVRSQPPPGRAAQLGLAFRLATELVAGFVVGAVIGWYLDRWLGTSPWFLLIFFGLGAAAGVMNVVRTARLLQESADEQDTRPQDDTGPGAHDAD